MNRLAAATSPYLRQHAHQLVDWWPWEDAAFERARLRGVPVFLSVGYSACHWCHVMAHESFDDAEVAAALNDGYVAIKVDREERPDIDTVYMAATQATTGRGGWPMTVFLTPDGEPFHCGTYYPKGQLLALLSAVRAAWVGRRSEVLTSAAHLTSVLRESYADQAVAVDAITPTDLDGAVAAMERDEDQRNGGFGVAPKFPPSMVLEALLRHAHRTGSAVSAGLAARACEAMARGGIYDQVAGGFARYAVDAAWRVPHFEKMLYDNALLARVYLHWWQTSGSALALRVTRETCDWIVEQMGTPDGGFASALDADTEGVEGATYLWTPESLAEVLGPEDGATAARLLLVGDGPMVEGGWTLALPHDPEEPSWWGPVRARLQAARDQRPQPARDDKVVTAWNGLAIAALAQTGMVLDEPRYVDAARTAASFLLACHRVDGRLRRSSLGGLVGAASGVSEDYGNLVEGLLVLYQATSDASWLSACGPLLETALDHFSAADGGFFDTADDESTLVARPRSSTDNAEPSGQAALAHALLTYGLVSGSSRHVEAARRAVAAGARLVRAAPRFAGWAWSAAEALQSGPLQVVVVDVGGGGDELRRTAVAQYLPGGVVVTGLPDAPGQPLFADRPGVAGRSAAYVCRGTTCDAPVTTAARLSAGLRG